MSIKVSELKQYINANIVLWENSICSQGVVPT